VPAALCGVFATTMAFITLGGVVCQQLRPLDRFARSVRDTFTAFDVLQGPDEHDRFVPTAPLNCV